MILRALRLFVLLVVAGLAPAAQAAPATTALGGDLSGPPSSASVVKIRGRAVSATAPGVGDVYGWNGSSWIPTAISGGSFTGNLLGSTITNTATGAHHYGAVCVNDTQGWVLTPDSLTSVTRGPTHTASGVLTETVAGSYVITGSLTVNGVTNLDGSINIGGAIACVFSGAPHYGAVLINDAQGLALASGTDRVTITVQNSSPYPILSVDGGLKAYGTLTANGDFLAQNSMEILYGDRVAIYAANGLQLFLPDYYVSGAEVSRTVPLRATSTNNASPQELTTDDAGTTYLPAMADGETWAWTVQCVARGTAGTNDNLSASSFITCLIKRVGASTSIVGFPANTSTVDVGPSWAFTAVADDTNERLAVKFTGDGATTVAVRGFAVGTRVQ